MLFTNKKNESMKRKLDSIIDIAQNIIVKSEVSSDFLHPIYRYINNIGSSVLQKLLMQLFTGQEVDDIDILLYDLCRFVRNHNYCSECFSIKDNEN